MSTLKPQFYYLYLSRISVKYYYTHTKAETESTEIKTTPSKVIISPQTNSLHTNHTANTPFWTRTQFNELNPKQNPKPHITNKKKNTIKLNI